MDRRPEPEPLETNELATIGVGTALWAVALVVLLVLVLLGDRLGPERHWWVWTCVAGVGLGLIGLWIVHRRDLARKRARGAAPEPSSTPPTVDGSARSGGPGDQPR